MILELKIRLTKSVLGDEYDNSNGAKRILPRNHQGQVSTDYTSWESHLNAAGRSLDLLPLVTRIDLPDTIPVKSTGVLERTFVPKGGTKRQRESFEFIREGTILSIVISFDGEDLELPDVRRVFEFIGTYYGMSYWGSRMGYGRFEVLSLEHTDTFSNRDTGNETTTDRSVHFGQRLSIGDSDVSSE